MFGEMDQVTIYNPTNEDFIWGANGAKYRVKAKTMRVFPGGVAELGIKHLVDKLIIEDGKTLRMNDLVVRKEYEDMIIKRVEKLAEPEGQDEQPVFNEGAAAEVNVSREEPIDLDEPATVDIDNLPPSDDEIYKAPPKAAQDVPGDVEEAFPDLNKSDTGEGVTAPALNYNEFVKIGRSEGLSMKEIGEKWQALKK